jgi:hypothetical protein
MSLTQKLTARRKRPPVSKVTLLFQIPFYCLKQYFELRELVNVFEEACLDYRVKFSEIKITPVLGQDVDPNKPVTKKGHPLMYLVLVTLEGRREDLDFFYEWWRADVLEHPTRYFSANPANWLDSQVLALATKNKTSLGTKKLLENHKFEYEPILIAELWQPDEVKEVQAFFEEQSVAWQLSFPSLTMDDVRVFDFDFLLDKALFKIAAQRSSNQKKRHGLFPLREKDLIPFFDESIVILFPSPSEWGMGCRVDRKPYP